MFDGQQVANPAERPLNVSTFTCLLLDKLVAAVKPELEVVLATTT